MENLITIEEVITQNRERFGEIQKRGKNFFCKCPFHKDQTASMSLNFKENIYHCFSCGAKGDAISLKAKLDGVSKDKAKKDLLKKKGIITRQRDVIFDVNDAFSEYSHRLLCQTKAGIKVLEYLHNRGITDKQIEKFYIGYIDDKDNFKNLLEELKFKEFDILDSNLLNKAGKPFFQNRIVIPVKDVSDDIVTFVGRDIKDNVCKYLNGNETRIYKKSNNLFNINRQNKDEVFLVEGVFDVMSFDAIGLWAVASLGTALTKEQVKLLKKQSVKKVIVAYDGDKAGVKATFRVKQLLDEEGLDAEYLYLPDKLDPNELLSAGRLEKIANRRMSFSDWYLCLCLNGVVDDKIVKKSFSLVESANDLNHTLNFWSKKLELPRTEVYTFYKKEKTFTNQRLENIILSYGLEKEKYLKTILKFAPIMSERLNEKALKIKQMTKSQKEEALEKTKSLRLLCFEDAISNLLKQS